jgi:hypothetical protein
LTAAIVEARTVLFVQGVCPEFRDLARHVREMMEMFAEALIENEPLANIRSAISLHRVRGEELTMWRCLGIIGLAFSQALCRSVAGPAQQSDDAANRAYRDLR